MLKILEYKKSLSMLNLNIFTFKQDTVKFLCAYENNAQEIKQKQQQIFIFTEIEYHRSFYKQMLNRVFKFYQALNDPKYTEMNVRE